jgi:hypothetical protein
LLRRVSAAITPSNPERKLAALVLAGFELLMHKQMTSGPKPVNLDP